jgi:hypothetical protein
MLKNRAYYRELKMRIAILSSKLEDFESLLYKIHLLNVRVHPKAAT